MSVINDDKFIRQTLENQDAGNVFNQKKFNPADLTGIANKDAWSIKRTLGSLVDNPSSEDDKYPIGTLVEFYAPDGTEYKGRVASKSGRDYIIEISAGESYLVPEGKLATVTPESDKIKEAMGRHVVPTIKLISKPEIEMMNRCCARIAYKERHPTDDDLIRWAADHYPDWRLVDAIEGENREIGLIFEIIAMEDDKPQGGDQVNRGRALSSEEIEGTGVIASEDEYKDQFPGGLADDKTPDDFCPYALEDGINVEMEHTDDPSLAREIAMDHLTEDPNYYQKLKKIESSIITFDDITPTTFKLGVVTKVSQVRPAPGFYSLQAYDQESHAIEWLLMVADDDAVLEILIEGISKELHYSEDKPKDPNRLQEITAPEQAGQTFQEVTLNEMAELLQQVNIPFDIYVDYEKIGAKESDINGHFAQVGDPGQGDNYKDLVHAARWVLARFNDSNPNYYAVPQKSVEMAGDPENRVVRIPFILQAKDENDDLSHMYISRSGQLFNESNKSPDMQLVHGFVQVDDQGNLPMVMLNTPIGPESVQEYGFNFSAEREIVKLADYDACIVAADEILDEFGGYSAEAQAAYDAHLIKLGVDPKAKEYWSGYFKDYGKMFTRDIPRKKHDKKKTASIDSVLREYWTNYFGSGVYNDKWYGEALVRDIPRRIINDKSSSPQESAPKKEDTEPEDIESEETQKKKATSYELERYKKIASDYAAYIKEEGGKYCVKSKSNPKWSGGCYDTKEEAEERLGQVEMFKHMSIKACITDGIPADIDFIDDMAIVGTILDDIIHKRADFEADTDIEALFGFGKKPAPKASPAELKNIVNVAQWALEAAEEDPQIYSAVYSLVYDFLRQYPNFLVDKVKEKTLTPRGVGYTLVYALRESPKALKQMKKIINQYQKRWQTQKFKGLEQESKEWRQKQKELRKGKPPKPERGEGPTEGGLGEKPITEGPPPPTPTRPSKTTQQEQLQVELPSTQQPKKPIDIRQLKRKPQEQVPTESTTLPQGFQMEYTSMKKKQADAAPGPITHNAPGKDDKKDYDHKDNRTQPSRSRMRFKVTRMYSTTSSSDNGYIYMDISWDPDVMINMSDQNIQQSLISYVKGLESTKEFHDFGVMGRVRIMEFDKDAGVAKIKVRCSETRGVPTLGYNGDLDEPVPLSGIR